MSAEQAVARLRDGEILLLENLRFHAGEETNDAAFAAALAKSADLYVDDAFSVAHRAHASVAAITGLLPAYAGRGMEAELAALHQALGNPDRPVVAIVGGAKVSTKLALLDNLVTKVEALVLGGGMANTFLAARGVDVGNSLYESHMLDTARTIEDTARKRRCTIVLPVDAVIAEKLAPGQEARTAPIDRSPADRMILDVGPVSIQNIIKTIETCRTVVWNGPLGAFETEPFDRGTVAVARAVADLTRAGQTRQSSAAAATPCRHSGCRRRRGRLPMFPPPAAPFWNGWKARSCRGSSHCFRHNPL